MLAFPCSCLHTEAQMNHYETHLFPMKRHRCFPMTWRHSACPGMMIETKPPVPFPALTHFRKPGLSSLAHKHQLQLFFCFSRQSRHFYRKLLSCGFFSLHATALAPLWRQIMSRFTLSCFHSALIFISVNSNGGNWTTGFYSVFKMEAGYLFW